MPVRKSTASSSGDYQATTTKVSAMDPQGKQGPNLASSFEELAVANCTMLTWQNNKPQQATELGKASASVVAVVMKPQ